MSSARIAKLASRARTSYESHTVVWLFGLMLACFLSGISFLQAALQLTGRTIVSESQIEAGEREAGDRAESLAALKAAHDQTTKDYSESQARLQSLLRELERVNNNSAGEILLVSVSDVTKDQSRETDRDP